jgi:uncharacterized protein
MSHQRQSGSSNAVDSLAGKLIDSAVFARDCGTLSGSIAVADMARLKDLVGADVGAVDVVLDGNLDDQHRPWLHLEVRGELELVCQRCLGALPHAFAIEAHLRLIRAGEPWPGGELEEESELDAEDAIEASEALSVLELVEDEIILDLPYAPMHEDCGVPGKADASTAASPFAALAVLKKY